jgi:CheY-like chemotaxis protein
MRDATDARFALHSQAKTSCPPLGCSPACLARSERYTVPELVEEERFASGLALRLKRGRTESEEDAVTRSLALSWGIHARSHHRSIDLDGVRALVVDDEPDARDLVRRVLEEHGAVVSTVASGEQALGALEADPPDVLLSDIGMPGMDGYQLMRSVRASGSGHRRVPAIALTAFARGEDRKKALLAGYQSHLAKPFDIAELVIVVAGLVDRTAKR